MFNVLALTAVAYASPVVNGVNMTTADVPKSSISAIHAVERAAKVEMETSKKAFRIISKQAKLAALQSQYSEYQFFKLFFKRLNYELGLNGPSRTCKAAVFARCVAKSSENRTRLDDDDFNFIKAIQHYPTCTAQSGCASDFSKMTPAQKTRVSRTRRRSDITLKMARMQAKRNLRNIRSTTKYQLDDLKEAYMRKQGENIKNAANKISGIFKCDNDCLMDQVEKNGPNLERAWMMCNCRSPDIKFSPEEVLNMMSQHNLDTTAGIDEEDVEFAAEPTSESGSWGWMAFGALATANAAYFVTKKN